MGEQSSKHGASVPQNTTHQQKKEQTITCATTWMNIKEIVLSEKSQS